MKRLVGISALALGVVVAAAVCRADGSGQHFSNKSLKGVYVVKFQGTNSGGSTGAEGESLAPVNGVGLLNADGKGGFSGTQTANILFNNNGAPTAGNCPAPFTVCTAICTTTLSGTYTINPDGTGTTKAHATPAANSDPRCGPAGGFDTSSDVILQSASHLVFVGTDFDATVGGQATLQSGFNGD